MLLARVGLGRRGLALLTRVGVFGVIAFTERCMPWILFFSKDVRTSALAVYPICTSTIATNQHLISQGHQHRYTGINFTPSSLYPQYPVVYPILTSCCSLMPIPALISIESSTTTITTTNIDTVPDPIALNPTWQSCGKHCWRTKS